MPRLHRLEQRMPDRARSWSSPSRSGSGRRSVMTTPDAAMRSPQRSTPSDPKASNASRAGGHTASDRMLSVMIVGHEALIAMDLEMQVEMAGHTVHVMPHTADEAVREGAPTRPDVVLMDLRSSEGSACVRPTRLVHEDHAIRACSRPATSIPRCARASPCLRRSSRSSSRSRPSSSAGHSMSLDKRRTGSPSKRTITRCGTRGAAFVRRYDSCEGRTVDGHERGRKRRCL